MIQDSFEVYLKFRGPYIGDPKCLSYSYDDLQEAFSEGLKLGYKDGSDMVWSLLKDSDYADIQGT